MSDFIATPASQAIRTLMGMSRATRSPSLIIGPPGCGKTVTAKQLALYDGVRLFTVTHPKSRIRAFLVALADLFDASIARGGNAAEVETTLSYVLARRAEEGEALIVDEAQGLELVAMRSVLELAENAQLPLMFIGNPAVLKRRRSEAAAFDQIEDRIIYKRTIRLTPADFEAFGAQHNLEGRDAYAALVRYGEQTSLRQVAGLLVQARMCAGPKGPLTLKHLTEAAGVTHGADAARKLARAA